MARTVKDAADVDSPTEGETATKAALTRQRIPDAAAHVLSTKGFELFSLQCVIVSVQTF